MERDVFLFETANHTPADIIDLFRQYYGPTMNAFDAAGKSGRTEELYAQLVATANEQNKAADGTTSIPATFMRVTVQL